MADEFYHFQDMPRSKIHIEGAPVWDHLFNREQEMDKKEFLDSLGLSDKLPTAYFPLCSEFWHADNIKTLKRLFDEKKQGRLQDLQFIFRLHPYYLSNETKRNEIISVFDQNQSLGGVYLDVTRLPRKYWFHALQRG